MNNDKLQSILDIIFLKVGTECKINLELDPEKKYRVKNCHIKWTPEDLEFARTLLERQDW